MNANYYKQCPQVAHCYTETQLCDRELVLPMGVGLGTI